MGKGDGEVVHGDGRVGRGGVAVRRGRGSNYCNIFQN